MDNPTDNGSKRKRYRVSKACDACRKKKVKCDGDTPICYNCVQSQLKCTYLDTTKKRGPPRGYIDAIESRLHRLESLLGGLIQNEDPHAQALLQSLINDDVKVPKQTRAERLAAWRNSPLAREAESMDQSSEDDKEDGKDAGTAPPKPRRPSPTAKEGPISDSASSEGFLDLSDALGQLEVAKNQEIHYFGKTPTSFVMKLSRPYHGGPFNASDSVGTSDTQPLEDVQEQDVHHAKDWMPSQELSDHLLDTYFLYIHPGCPIIYKPSFRRPIVGEDMTWPPALLCAMYCIACLHTDRKDVRTIPEQPGTAGDTFFEQTRVMVLDSFKGDGSVAAVQASLLLAIREYGCGRLESAWIWTGSGIRLGQSLGLHRDCTKWQLATKKLTHEETESRKRAFGVMLACDRYLAVSLGRPMGIDDRDFDTPPPNEDEADEHEPVDGPPFSQQDGSAPVQPTSGRKMLAISFLNKIVQLLEIMGRIIRSIYASKLRVMTISPERLLSVLDSALTSWLASLPSHMRYQPNIGRIRASQVVKLHTMYHTAVILLHRPFADPNYGEVTVSRKFSLSICTDAAAAICKMIEIYGREHDQHRLLLGMINPLVQAASIHLCNATHGERQTMLASKLQYSKCKGILTTMQVNLTSAKTALDILQGAIDHEDVGGDSPAVSAGSKLGVGLTKAANAGSASSAKSLETVGLSPSQTYSYSFLDATPATLTQTIHPLSPQVLPNGQFDPADYINMPFSSMRQDPSIVAPIPYTMQSQIHSHENYGPTDMGTSQGRVTPQPAIPNTREHMPNFNASAQAQLPPQQPQMPRQVPPPMPSRLSPQMPPQVHALMQPQMQTQMQTPMQPNTRSTGAWSNSSQDNREMMDWSNYLQSQIMAAKWWADQQSQNQPES